jgi:hypothetical protein
MTGTPAAIRTDDELSVAMQIMRDELSLKWEEGFIVTPLGRHGVTITEDMTEGPYATIGMVLDEHVYVEIEDGTYGQMQGFRIYKEDL